MLQEIMRQIVPRSVCNEIFPNWYGHLELCSHNPPYVSGNPTGPCKVSIINHHCSIWKKITRICANFFFIHPKYCCFQFLERWRSTTDLGSCKRKVETICFNWSTFKLYYNLWWWKSQHLHENFALQWLDPSKYGRRYNWALPLPLDGYKGMLK